MTTINQKIERTTGSLKSWLLDARFRLDEVRTALGIVFEKRSYRVLALLATLTFAAFYWLFPVFAIPGNTFSFWLAAAPWYSYLFLAIFSLSMGALVAMQAYVLKQRASLPRAAVGAGGLFSGVVSGVYASAACAGCISAFAVFLGGSASLSLFLLENQSLLVLIGLVLLAVSLYYNARTVNRHCASCQAPRRGF